MSDIFAALRQDWIYLAVYYIVAAAMFASCSGYVNAMRLIHAKSSNQSLERTAAHCAFTFQMTRAISFKSDAHSRRW
jgi:hypothetical protein